MEMKITDAGKALVRSAEFAALVTGWMRTYGKQMPIEMAAQNVVRIICLALCEIGLDHGPALDSPELESFAHENKEEIETVGRDFIAMLTSTRVVH